MQLRRNRKGRRQGQVNHFKGGAEPLHGTEERVVQQQVQRLCIEGGMPEVRGVRQGALRQEDLFELQALVRPFLPRLQAGGL